jgi:hypothetical protein
MTTTVLRAPESAGISHPWPEPPAMGGLIAVAPGIKWLRMPLPFRLDHIIEPIGLWRRRPAGDLARVFIDPLDLKQAESPVHHGG